MHKKTEKSILRFFIYKKFKKQFHFFTCILPSYVFNESTKEFWKNSNFENMRANFHRRCQNSLRQNSPKIMHFQDSDGHFAVPNLNKSWIKNNHINHNFVFVSVF